MTQKQNRKTNNEASNRLEGGLRIKGLFNKKSEPDRPLLSIITVCFNSEKYLEQTIQSVINQTYDNIEYIIIDGGSTDSTLDIIRKYEDKIAYWVSEPDKGISDAFNKGINLAIGKLIGVINSDDWYKKDAIGKIVRCYLANKNSIIAAGMKIVDGNRLLNIRYSNPKKLKWKMSLCHISTFIPKHIYKKYGLYDINKKVAMDHELLLRYYIYSAPIIPLNEIISNHRLKGMSDKYLFIGYKEVKENIIKYTGSKLRGYLAFSILCIKGLIFKLFHNV